jgi:cell shape-determining protein MreD
MKVFVYIIVGLICMLFESSLSSHVSMELFKPDFGIPLVIYITFFLGPYAGLVAVLCVGFIQEGLSVAPHGSIMFVVTCIFLITTFMKNKLYIDSKYSFAAVCSAAIVFESLLFITFSLLARGEAGNAFNILFYTIPNAVFTGFVSLFIYSVIEYMNANYLDRE